MSLNSPRVGDVVARRYRIVECLGEGAMCTVFRAADNELGRQVALKVPKEAILTSTQGVARFVREARAAGRLAHRNVVDVYHVGGAEFGDAQEPPYIVMEYVPGGDLRDRFDAGWSLERSLHVLAGVAHALEAAHRVSLVHRDLKPENVLISDDDQAKVTDWGLSKILDERTALTATGALVGTPLYMAPEQVRRAKVGPAADWYALGLIIYEAVLVAEGWTRHQVVDLVKRQLKSELPPIESVLPRVHPRLVKVTSSLLVRQPTARVRKARWVVRELSEVARDLGQASSSNLDEVDVVSRNGDSRLPAHPVLEGGVSKAVGCAVMIVVAVLGWSWMGAWSGSGEVTRDLIRGESSGENAGFLVRRVELVHLDEIEIVVEMKGDQDIFSLGEKPQDDLAIGIRRRDDGIIVSSQDDLVWTDVALKDLSPVSRRLGTLNHRLDDPVVEELQIVIRNDTGQVLWDSSLSGRDLVNELLEPVRRLGEGRLGDCLRGIANLRRRHGRPDESEDDADRDVQDLLESFAIDPDVIRVVDAFSPQAFVRHPLDSPDDDCVITILRMIESQLAGLPAVDLPWQSVGGRLGYQVVDGLVDSSGEGCQTIVSKSLLVSKPRPSQPSRIVRIPRWILDPFVLERTRDVRRMMVEASLGTDTTSLAWSTAQPETQLDFVLPAVSDHNSRMARMVFHVGQFWREARLMVEINERAHIMIVNDHPGEQDFNSTYTISCPVDLSWFIPGGINVVRVSARSLPGVSPLAATSLARFKIVLRDG